VLERGEVEVLVGGTANRGQVVRVGDTVRRPRRPTSPATHALLRHLADVGFDGAPRFLGVDDLGREVLSYVPGTAITPPYPPWALTDEALVSVAHLLHAYHEAVSTFDPTPHAWPLSPPAPFAGELISHNDVNLDNVVFREGRAVALIDFDLASPGSRVWDVACAARLWVPLRPEPCIDDARQGRVIPACGCSWTAVACPGATASVWCRQFGRTTCGATTSSAARPRRATPDSPSTGAAGRCSEPSGPTSGTSTTRIDCATRCCDLRRRAQSNTMHTLPAAPPSAVR
jgi:Phosphotransferase enzyme family